MPYAGLETATLGDVDENYYYSAYCQKCQHGARLSLPKQREHFGADFPPIKVRERLRCERCSARDPIIGFLTPEHRTGILVQFFTRQSR
jgi:hypothetical protein